MITDNINVNLVPFPSTRIKELVRCNEDDSYTILINKDIAHNQQIKAYQHALSHIIHDDFHSDMSVQDIENRRHNER